jgi:hypothetical protein
MKRRSTAAASSGRPRDSMLSCQNVSSGPGAGWQRIAVEDGEVAFCCDGCRRRFEADPARYATRPDVTLPE